MNKYYFEFHGGLGDILQKCYLMPEYRFLDTLGSEDLVNITLVCDNPGAMDIFNYHPARDRIIVRQVPFFRPEEDATSRIKYNLPSKDTISTVAPRTEMAKFYTMDRLKYIHNAIIIQPGAGDVHKRMPIGFAECICAYVISAGQVPILIGRNYQSTKFDYSKCIALNLIDLFTVPGTINLIRHSAGVITTHSVSNIIAWNELTPQICLYPEYIERLHIKPATATGFYGVGEQDNRFCRFEYFKDNAKAIVTEWLHEII